MKYKAIYIVMAVALIQAFSAKAQSETTEEFAIKATADIGIGNALSTDSPVKGMGAKSSSSDFGVDFGWTFWRQIEHSLEANIGLRYGSVSTKAHLPAMDYHYSAPAAADMDNEPYIRYYELGNIHQKISTGRLAIPIYVKYRYEINERFSVHALAGMKIGFNVSSKIGNTKGEAFSYGVYPQYNDLMIDAPYMNEFGESTLTTRQTLKPSASPATFSLMAGIGAEVRVWGPISADLTIKYEGAVNNMYKSTKSGLNTFDAKNAPVRYTVAKGQQVEALSSYLTSSKLSRFSIAISAIYHF